jgi:hypothetical protein
MARLIYPVLAAAVLLALRPHPASADEVIQLLDKTKIVGKLIHFYDGVLTVKLPNGTKVQLPSSKVARLSFKLPRPRPAYSTPQKTFKLMRRAALKGDLQGYIDAHSAYYQMFLNHQIAMLTPGKFIKRLKKEWGAVQLEVVGTQIKGDMAVMKVRRRQGTESQDGELRFVKENKEWKMILPL